MLLPILEKESFFTYIIQNELYGLLKRWLNEQYLCRAGKTIKSTISQPQTFEEALNYLFRMYTFEEAMMEKISRREKDVIKNDFAKLALFESREVRNVARKINRLFTTHTFNENYHLAVKNDEVTQFIIDNKLTDLLCEKFIDHKCIQEVLTKESNIHPIKDELILIETMKDLLSKETSMEDFIRIMNVTTEYLTKHDKTFNENRNDLMLINGSEAGSSLDNFHKIAGASSFLK